MPRLIDAEKLMKTIMSLESWNVPDFVYESIKNASPVDAVPKADYDHLLKRFRHLIQSDYIRSFDAWDSRKNDYVLDIRDAEPVRHGHWIKERNPMMYHTIPYVWVCDQCGTAFYYNAPYCGECGAKMDEVEE